jgi:hypothetical protein
VYFLSVFIQVQGAQPDVAELSVFARKQFLAGTYSHPDPDIHTHIAYTRALVLFAHATCMKRGSI